MSFCAYYGVFYGYDSANQYPRIEVSFDTSEATIVVLSKSELKVTTRLLAGLRYESHANLNNRSLNCDRHRVNSARGAIFLAMAFPSPVAAQAQYLTTSRSISFKSCYKTLAYSTPLPLVPPSHLHLLRLYMPTLAVMLGTPHLCASKHPEPDITQKYRMPLFASPPSLLLSIHIAGRDYSYCR